MSDSFTFAASGSTVVSGLLDAPPSPRACYVLAHGAGAGMTHAFLATIADGLVERGIATLRYQFPYMEQGARRPDLPKVAHATVRAAVLEAGRRLPGVPLFAGGKSFGGRMTSQAQAAEPLPDVRGLIFLGFPLHPAGKASVDRAKHLFEIGVPMLFVQGTRDKLAELQLLEPVCRELGQQARSPQTSQHRRSGVSATRGPGVSAGGDGASAGDEAGTTSRLSTLRLIRDADHSFKVPARSGRKQPEVFAEILDAIAGWMTRDSMLATDVPSNVLRPTGS